MMSISGAQRGNVIIRALTLRILYLCMNDGKDHESALEMTAGYAMVRSETASKWERDFLTKGHIKVSEQGHYERHFVLGVDEDILAEVKEWVGEHTGRVERLFPLLNPIL
ncbi:unnamed protein product [Choristocarpus tenellus]